MTSGALAAGKLVLFLALHSCSLALEKDELSLTGGAKEKESRGEVKGKTGTGRCSHAPG